MWNGKIFPKILCVQFACFVCLFESHEQFFSYLATVTITGDRAANLDICLALVAFSSEGSFTCHTYCDTGPPFLRSYPKNPWFYLLNAVLLAREQSLPILNVLGLTQPAQVGLELTTSRSLSESTTTKLSFKPIKQVRITGGFFCLWLIWSIKNYCRYIWNWLIGFLIRMANKRYNY
jgi:hypothetical protein